MPKGRKSYSGAYGDHNKKGGIKAKSPFKSRKMPKNKGNEVKASHKG